MPSKVHEVSANSGFPGSFRNTPLFALRKVFVRFCQGLFAAAPPGNYHWASEGSEDDNSEIYISDESPIKTEKVGTRPAISFTRGQLQFYSLGMDDLLYYRQDTGKKTKSVLVPGTMNINCVSRSDIEADNIAWIVAEHLWVLRDLLIGSNLFFEIGRQPIIMPPTQAGSLVAEDQGEGWYASTVVEPFQFHRTTARTPLGEQILNSVELSLSTRHTNVGSKGPPLQSHELPLSIQNSFPPSFAPNASDAYGSPDPAGLKTRFLPKQPHPLHPSKQVTVRTVYPLRQGLRPRVSNPAPVPISDLGVKESDVTQLSVTGETQV